MAEYIVKRVHGEVFVRAPDGGKRALKVGDVVRENDVIETGDAASVQLDSGNGLVTEIGENTTAALTAAASEIQEPAQDFPQDINDIDTGELTQRESHSFVKIPRTEYMRDNNLEYARDINVTEALLSRATSNPRVKFAFSLYKEFEDTEVDERFPFDDSNGETNFIRPWIGGTHDPRDPIFPDVTGIPKIVPVALENSVTEDSTPSVSDNALAGVDNSRFVAGISVTDPVGTYGTVTMNPDGTYTYTLDNSDPKVQALAEGEKLQEVFSVVMTDRSGRTYETTLTITVNGTNDTPLISVETGDSASADLTEGFSSSASGTLTVTDIDIKDAISEVNVDRSSTAIEIIDGSGNRVALTPDQHDSLLKYLNGDVLKIEETGVDGTGKLSWNFDASGLDFLADGDKLTVVYKVNVVDSSGNNSSDTSNVQDVTVVINGTRTDPVLSNPEVANTAEDNSLMCNGNVIINGNITGDRGDTFTVSKIDGNSSGVGHEINGTYGKITVNPDGSYTYTLNNGTNGDISNIVQGLAENESVQDTFTVTIVNQHGKEVTSTITVNVRGTNDAPVISVENGDSVSADLTEDSSASGTLTVTDIDIKDTISNVDIDRSGTTIELKDGSGNVINLTSQQQADLMRYLNGGAFAIGQTGGSELPNDGTTGGLTWNFDASGLDFLADGDKLTVVYKVNATDSSGNKSNDTSNTQDVTITITGTNSAPIVQNDAQSVKEDTHASAKGNVLTGSLEDGFNDTHDGGAHRQGGADSDPDRNGQLKVKDIALGNGVSSSVEAGGTTVDGTYGYLKINPDGSYEYKLYDSSNSEGYKKVQALSQGEEPTEEFTLTVTDENGSTANSTLTIYVNGTNDAPIAADDTNRTVQGETLIIGTDGVLKNDSDIDNGDSFEVVNFKIAGQSIVHTAGSDADIYDEHGVKIGTINIKPDGSYTFDPEDGYSGSVPTITYTIEDKFGGQSSANLNLTINNGAITAPEDTLTILELSAPALPSTERIDTITLDGVPSGAKIFFGDTELTGSKIVIVDSIGNVDTSIHHNSVTTGQSGVVYMTQEQFLSLSILPPEDSHADIGSIQLKYTSYSPDGTTQQQDYVIDVPVEVHAVTDDVNVFVKDNLDPNTITGVEKITITNDGRDTGTDADNQNTSGGGATVTVSEDTQFNIKDLIDVKFGNSSAASSNDGKGDVTDGSETRWVIVSGLPKGAIVNGTTIGDNGEIKIDLSSSNQYALPDIKITPPKDFSGKIENVQVTLYGKDTDADSSADTRQLSDSITLNLDVVPTVDTPIVTPQKVEEDSGDKNYFLTGLKLSDSLGSEDITSITIDANSLNNWKIYDKNNNEITADPTGKITIDIADKDSYYIVPPGGSSSNLTPSQFSGYVDVKVTVTVEDSAVTSEGSQTVSKTFTDVDVRAVVTPVAEKVGGENSGSDTDYNNDLVITSGHTYATAITAKENEGFNIKVSSGDSFDLKTGWSNPDTNASPNMGEEKTYALLTPYLKDGYMGSGGQLTTSQTAANGAYFTYTDGSGATIKVTFNGSAVRIPMEYLDTVKFYAPANAYGEFEIKVQGHTTDILKDSVSGNIIAQNSATSGEAWLKGIVITPIADRVSLSVASPEVSFEDNQGKLHITPQSGNGDPNEYFDVTLSGFPSGVTQVTYNGQSYSVSGGAVTISMYKADIDAKMPVTFTPPKDWSGDEKIGVSAVSVVKWIQNSNGTTHTDTLSSSDASKLDINIVVRGVPDEPNLEVATGYSAAESEAETSGILIKNLITKTEATDADGSEIITLRLTGLEEGFSIEGARLLVGGTGTERVWMIDPKDMNNVKITVPNNYNGNVSVKVIPITTEADGASTTWDGNGTDIEGKEIADKSQTVNFTVTPTPEGTMTLVTGTNEDTLQPVVFGIIHQNGDTDEILDAVYIKASDLDASKFKLYYGNDTSAALDSSGNIPAGANGITYDSSSGYYKLTGGAINNIYVQGAQDVSGQFNFDVKYDISDPYSDGSGTPVTSQSTGTYELNIAPVTDTTTMQAVQSSNFGSIGTNSSLADTTVTVTGSTAFTVNVTVNPPTDQDGSESLLYLIISGVPDGVSITNTGAVYYGDGPDGNGIWAVPVTGTFSGATGHNFALSYSIDAGNPGLWEINGSTNTISIKAVSQDKLDSLLGAEEESATSADWDLTIALPTGPGPTPYGGVPLIITPGGGTIEDSVNATLNDLVEIKIDTNDSNYAAGREYRFELVISGLPEGMQIDKGIIPFVVGADGKYTISGYGDQDYIDSLLQNIKVTLPKDFNDNNGSTQISIEWQTWGQMNSGAVSGSAPDVDYTVTPVTDEATMIISAGNVAESQTSGTDATSTTVTIQLDNPSDGQYSQIIDGKIYISADLHGGELKYNGSALTTVTNPSGLTPGTYYVINVSSYTFGAPLTLTYYPTQYFSGSISLIAYVLSQELNATDTLLSSSTGSFEITPVNSGVEAAFGEMKGDEDNMIQLNGLNVALNDTDGSEYITSISISGVPDGALIYVGADAASAKLAFNAGNGVWMISGSDGKVPPYVAVNPIANWSGELDLKLQVLSGENALAPSETEFDLTVDIAPIADGVTIKPTYTFGKVGETMALNLNNSMNDTDGSETLSVQLNGFQCADIKFYANGVLLSAVYDLASDTYEITGISAADANSDSLTFSSPTLVGTGNVDVTAWTVDTAVIDGVEQKVISGEITGSFDYKIEEPAANAADLNAADAADLNAANYNSTDESVSEFFSDENISSAENSYSLHDEVNGETDDFSSFETNFENNIENTYLDLEDVFTGADSDIFADGGAYSEVFADTFEPSIYIAPPSNIEDEIIREQLTENV